MLKLENVKEKYKLGADYTRTSTKFRGRIRCYFSADRSHPPRAFCRNKETGKSVDNSMINNGQTLSTKNVSQGLTYIKEKYTIHGRTILKKKKRHSVFNPLLDKNGYQYLSNQS